MYLSEISKSKVSGLKAQKKIILWTLKHVSAISEHPVFRFSSCICISRKIDIFVTLQMFMNLPMEISQHVEILGAN